MSQQQNGQRDGNVLCTPASRRLSDVGNGSKSCDLNLKHPMAPSGLTREQVVSAQLNGDYAIKPETLQPALDTSQWPLLLKNYDKLLVRSSHFTPIPVGGCSPLKRDITSYIKSVTSKLTAFTRSECCIGPVSLISTNPPTPPPMK